MKMEQAWIPYKDQPLKPEMPVAERQLWLETRHTFNNLLDILPERTPKYLQRERVYRDTLRKIKDLAEELEYYEAYGQG